MRIYELSPTDSHKSFYGKAKVVVDDQGGETLLSYGTPIMRRTATGEIVKLWNGWTAATSRHIRSFCGMNKAEFTALP